MAESRISSWSPLVAAACLLFFLILANADLAHAEDDPAAAADPAVGEVAPVVVDGEDLYRVRGSSSYPAKRRAKEIARRIAAVAGDSRLSPDSLRVVPVELGTMLVVQNHHIVTLLESDAQIESLTVGEYAEVCRRRTREAILDYRRDREPGRTLRNAIIATAVGLGLALLLVLFVRATRRIERWSTQRYRRATESLQGQAFQLLDLDRLWWVLRAATGVVRTVAVLAVIYLYLQWSLGLFPWTRLFGRTLLSLVSDPVRQIFEGFIGYLPELFFLIVLVVVGRWLMHAVSAFFQAVERGTIVIRDFDAEWAQPTYRIVRIVLFALFVVIAYPYIPGSNSAAFKGVSLLFGLLFSLGSSSIVANLIAGYSMIYRRAFRIGDRIRINDQTGDVVAIRPLVTTLRTPKNEEIIIPNSELLNSPIVNYSALARSDGLILHTTVGIGYEVPWRQVEAMLLLAAERTDGLRRDRPAFVLQTSLGDFCVTYELNVACGSAQQMGPLYSALHRNIQDVFNEHGVQIMTPAYEGDPDTPKIVPPERWHEPPATPPAEV